MLTIEQVAELCHETARVYCQLHDDHLQQPWSDCPQDLKDSVVEGVRYTLSHPNAQDDDIHRNWMHKRMAQGWKPGPVKDPTIKEHPNLLPFNQLPKQQQIKDRLFLAIVRAVAEPT